jgi:aminopeptidase N
VWLNEGFASYCEYLALEILNPAEAPATMREVHNRVMQSPGGSIWFEDTTNVRRIFDSRLTYDKGSAFVHTLRYEVNNDSLFFDFLKAYQQQFGHATANTLEFKALLEQKTGRSFSQVFDQWFYGEGFPTFNIRWNAVNDTLYMVSGQTTSSTATPLFMTPLDILVKRSLGGDTLIRLDYRQQNSNFKIPVSGTVTSLQVDPLNGMNEDGALSKLVYYYPNPATQSLTIYSLSVPVESVTVCNALGKIMFTTNGSTLDVSGLANGIYFFVVRTIDGETLSAQRFVKE